MIQKPYVSHTQTYTLTPAFVAVCNKKWNYKRTRQSYEPLSGDENTSIIRMRRRLEFHKPAEEISSYAYVM